MAGTISLSGLGVGSGLDTNGIVDALVGVERQGEQPLKDKLTATNASISNLSSVSSLLSKLKSASDALDTVSEVGSFKATSSSTALVASATGLASPGKYSIKINKLAQEQRSYSNTLAGSGVALGQSGTLTLAIGSSSNDIAIASTDTLDDVMNKINASGLRVSASSFYDGSAYRIQLRGLDTGAANAVSITETGTTFGFNANAANGQAAQDAEVEIDKFKVTSATNQITGAIRGVTLALTATTTDTVTVGVDNDPTALQTKLSTLVDAYNAVTNKLKALGGSSSAKPQDELLAGDSILRSIRSRISSALQTTNGTGTYNSLGSIGLSLDRSGLLTFDTAKFGKAMTADPSSVTSLLAGTDSIAAGGLMAGVSSAVDLFTRTGTGILATRTDAFKTQTKTIQDRIDATEARINRYADQLRKQFTAMDSQVAAYNAQTSYLTKLG